MKCSVFLDNCAKAFAIYMIKDSSTETSIQQGFTPLLELPNLIWIGMPYNYKKLLKKDNFCGHVNYSAPELI
jgi:hypothetical protein